MKESTKLTFAVLAASINMALTSPALASNLDSDHALKATAQAPSMDAQAKEIWDRSIEATMSENAADEWVKSMRLIGTMSMPSQGISAEMSILIAADKGMHVGLTIPGLGSFQQGVAGDVAWSSSMMEGPKVLEGDEAKQLMREVDLYADLHWDRYYSEVTFKGEMSVTMPDDTEVKANALELTDIEDGSLSTRYYDMSTGLLIMAETTVAMAGSKIPSTAYTMDYRDVDGIMIPFKTISRSGPIEQIIEFSTVTVNGKITDDELAIPEDVQELIED